ncbi:hypothetical protein NL676_017663 [Syzygium grande]|nr:hypothetical protein NL676_017663 [Syzygium grande]
MARCPKERGPHPSGLPLRLSQLSPPSRLSAQPTNRHAAAAAVAAASDSGYGEGSTPAGSRLQRPPLQITAGITFRRDWGILSFHRGKGSVWAGV